MIDKKITDLGTLNELEDTDKLLVGTSGDTYNVTVQTLKNVVQDGMVPSEGWGQENSGRVLAVSDSGDVELGGYWIPAVRYNEAQTLLETEKEQARDNIDAASKADISVINDRLADLEYVPIAFEELVFIAPVDGKSLEGIGTRVVIQIKLNKTPATLTINGNSINPLKEQRWNGGSVIYTSDTNFVVSATDERSPSYGPTTVTKTITLNFCNNIYYGAAPYPLEVNSSFVRSLSNSVLSDNKARTITLSAGSREYLWYAIPKRLGTCAFKVGGFDGGFDPPQTVSVANGNLYEEDYYVYHSTNAGLGTTTVAIT